MTADVARALEDRILALLERRGAGKTICPSDAARAVAGDGADWRDLMEPARQAARRLVESGDVVITQRGEIVDLDDAKGPIRIRRAMRWPAGPTDPLARARTPGSSRSR